MNHEEAGSPKRPPDYRFNVSHYGYVVGKQSEVVFLSGETGAGGWRELEKPTAVLTLAESG